MAWVYNVALDAGADPVDDAGVEIQLVSGEQPGITEDGIVLTTLRTRTDEDGKWLVELLPNSAYLQENTYYKVFERAGTFVNIFTFIVPDGLDETPVPILNLLADPADLPGFTTVAGPPGPPGGKGDKGDKGDQGNPGEAGGVGSPPTIIDFQASHFDVNGYLLFVHNRGYQPPAVDLEDSLGNDVEGEKEYVDGNTIRMYFNGFTFGGRARIA